MKKILIKTALIAIILPSTSCKKFLDIDGPATSTNQANVYINDYTSAAVLTGIYTQMMNDFSQGGITSISLTQELAADNLVLNDITSIGNLTIWRNSLTADYFNNAGYNNYFSNFYPKIYTINAAIEGINGSSTITRSVKTRLLGEAYFLRAFYYFYLVNLFGDTPLALTTDYTVNSRLSRSPSTDVYQQIIKDLNKSIENLDDNYVSASISNNTQERVRPNLSTAQALLARVQLYMKNYSDAEKTATTVINKTNIYSLTSLDSVFKKNSLETIWSLQPVKQGYNTDEAAIFLLTGIPGTVGRNKSFYLSNSLLSSFEQNDKRLTSWINTFSSGSQKYPFAWKYKTDVSNSAASSVNEYCIVFRLSELFLIRAEARAQQNDISGSQTDLNTIRKRAGLQPSNATTVSSILTAILQERRVEFFTEWGHRWFDIKRSGTVNQVMQDAMQYKGGMWSPYKSLYPIPNSEILVNANLTQNNGY